MERSDIDVLLKASANAPVAVQGLEQAVWARINRSRERAHEWRWHAALALAALAIGVSFGEGQWRTTAAAELSAVPGLPTVQPYLTWLVD